VILYLSIADIKNAGRKKEYVQKNGRSAKIKKAPRKGSFFKNFNSGHKLVKGSADRKKFKFDLVFREELLLVFQRIQDKIRCGQWSVFLKDCWMWFLDKKWIWFLDKNWILGLDKDWILLDKDWIKRSVFPVFRIFCLFFFLFVFRVILCC
jgi:hypothetical protein